MWKICGNFAFVHQEAGEMASAAVSEHFEGNPWDQIKARLAGKISSQAYQNWVMRTVFEAADGGVLRVAVPDQMTKDWMEQEYAEDIRTSLRELHLQFESVVFIPRALGNYARPDVRTEAPRS